MPSRFWIQWVIANAWAELVGLGVVAGAGFLAVSYLGEPSTLAAALVLAAVFVGLGAIEGLIVGFAQARVLRRSLPGLTGWVRATVVGAIFSWCVGMVPSTVMSTLSSDPGAAPPQISQPMRLLLAAGLGLVAGPLLAVFQWRRLRAVVSRAAWWLPANAVAWALGMPIIFQAAHWAAGTVERWWAAVTIGVCLFLAGGVVGAVHGWVLVALIRNRREGRLGSLNSAQ